MQIGYMRVSKADGSQSTDLQRDALRAAGVATRRLYEDRASAASMPGPDSTLP
jgi:DNA invertase Pin-like site-specific DNA recombinase